MKKAAKAPVSKVRLPLANSFRLIPALIILGYMLIPTYTPNLRAFDTNVPKFLALALVNLVAFIILMSDHELRLKPGQFTFFFRTKVGLVYTGFLAISLLSLFNSVNLTESVVQLTKIFTVFTAVYFLSVVLIRDLKQLDWVIIVFTGMLIFDSLSVFYYINEFIQGRIDQIDAIKTIYSNKNILSSALFVKLPFALWLLLNGKRWLKVMGWAGLATGTTAVFFMSTRAFYLGLIVLSFLLIVYFMVEYQRKKQKTWLHLAGYYLGALMVAYLAFSGTQQFLYPKTKGGRLTQGVTQQLATINASDASINVRIQSWKWSLDLLKEKPLLGVGSGNWKVTALKYENQQIANYEYLYKAHNDFIETAAETGFIGGLLYLGIFVLIAWNFIHLFLKGKNEEDRLFKYIFLSAAGVTFYAVDAFFNFPADRPEILVLFSFSLATGIAVTHLMEQPGNEAAVIPNKQKGQKLLKQMVAGTVIILLATTCYLFYLNFESSKLQRTAFEEIKSGTLISPSGKFLSGFPAIPNLNSLGEPIDVIKSRYLLNENKNKEAIDLLRTVKASPWDGRREYFMAMGFNNSDQPDSAMFYSEKLLKLKPNHEKNILILCQMLEDRKENNKTAEYLDTYLANNKKNSKAWVFASGFYDRTGNPDKAWEVIGEARKYIPKDTLVDQQFDFLYQKKFVDKYREKYTRAREEMDRKNYESAMVLINDYIGNVPGDFYAHQVKAYIYYYRKDYRECIKEIDHTLTLKGDNLGPITNLRGVCYHALNDMDSACKDFEAAMKLGEANGRSNYDRFCKNRL
jgi:O-antigen ligase/tetratricopeptide (TPR) repeat protein